MYFLVTDCGCLLEYLKVVYPGACMMSQSLICLNSSNLHVGGGVQVATSVIGELTRLRNLPNGLVIWASDEVDANLRTLGYDLSRLPTYEVVNSNGVGLLLSPLARRLQQFNAVLTLFGPLYVWRLAGTNITGFAQLWIINPDNEISRTSGWPRRIRDRLKFGLQSLFFKRADRLLVELEHVREGLIRKGIGSPSTVRVVKNCLSSIYNEPQSWLPVEVLPSPDGLRLGFVGRNYSHKNTRIFPEVIDLLRRKYRVKASIYVTFSDDEWAACDEAFRAAVINVGTLFVAQCPSFYRFMDAVIFPSLLECFSATPLEAMAMERPLFASDRPFNRDVCGEYANYFDPVDPDDAARAIAAYFQNSSDREKRLGEARMHALNFSNAEDRARQYLDCLIQAS